jgi:hypothetical protein
VLAESRALAARAEEDVALVAASRQLAALSETLVTGTASYEEIMASMKELGANETIDLGAARARSHCHFRLPLIHFTPESPTIPVPLFLNRQCDRTLGDMKGLSESLAQELALKGDAMTQVCAAARAVMCHAPSPPSRMR